MDGSITCTVNAEWVSAQGTLQRKFSHKQATLRLIRNDFKQIFIEISAPKLSAVRLQVKGISVFKRFMDEGKATIKFQEERCTLMLSNVPPMNLKTFLRTMFVKMTGEKPDNNHTSLRTQLLSGKARQFDEISPVTGSELETAFNKISKKTDTTPSPGSRKRKQPQDKNDRTQPPAAKKLYSGSPLPTEALNIQQKEVLEACLSGQNIFFTGSAGTGKSFLLRRIIAALPPDVTAATASTGVAACHIGGITLHQFAGIGSGEASEARSFELASKPPQSSIWRKCKHLIIDEISMIDGDYFEKIEKVARHVRNSQKPFGGIQLIVCGDFLQLPPVSKGKPGTAKFCFQTKAWSTCIQRSFELTQVHRQNEQEFIEILNSIRIGSVSQHLADKLQKTAKQTIEQDGILATRLCSHTQDANQINQNKLNALQGEVTVFEAQDSDKHLGKLLDQATPVLQKIELKVGAQVMLLKNINISEGLVNGARGVVRSYKDGVPVVKFRNKEYLARHERWVIKTASGATIFRRQIPLRLAWAFSIHKSQGLTLDCVEMSLGRVFEAGQAYVALSRAQSLKTLRVLDFKPSQVWANPDVLGFYKELRYAMDACRLIPLGDKTNKNKKQSTKSRIVKSLMNLKKPLVNIG